ncbi:hypothetical protein QC7_1588 [Clostridioides difficile CD38]|nr:hypothetical protein QC7_1588 [Clostridioides difficile CD38]
MDNFLLNILAFTFHIVNIKPAVISDEASPLPPFTFHIVNIKHVYNKQYNFFYWIYIPYS